MGDIEIKIAHCADLHIGSSSNTSEILKSFYNLIEICTNPDINIKQFTAGKASISKSQITAIFPKDVADRITPP